MIIESLTFAVGFTSSLLSMPAVMKFMRSRGIVGVDMHKLDRPSIPEMGGVAVLIGLTASILAAAALMPDRANILLAFLFSVFYSYSRDYRGNR